MSCFKYILVLFVIGCILPKLHAQDSSKVEIERQLEQNFEELDSEDSEITGEQLIQFLEDLAANPININRAGISELLQIPGFNLLNAKAVIEYRKKKPFESISDMVKVPGIGAVTYQRMSPYITVGSSSDRFRNLYTNPNYWLRGNKVEVISRYQQNLQDQEGFIRADTSGGYLGNAVKYFQRFRMQSNHLSVNLTQEKDAGETLTGISDFDFNSWHISIQEAGKLKSVVVGDYSLSFGQGLVIWNGGAFGKGREVTRTINRNERGVRPYGSAQETDFFRGLAATYGDNIQWTGFYSNRPRSATVLEGDTVRFPSSSGFHRTQSELDRRNNIEQETYGGRVRADTRFGLIGLTGFTTNFSNFIQKGTALSNQYDFEGKSNSVFGIDYRGLVGNSLVFGEFARSKNGGTGGVAGVEAPLGSKTDLALLYRNYQKNFQSFMGTGFGESSGDPNNEIGTYIGLSHRLTSSYSINGYIDQYSFKAPRSGVSQSTQGYDVLGLIEGRITAAFNAYILIRSEIKDDEYIVLNDVGREERLLGKEKRSSVRTQTEYQLSKKVRLRSRVEFVRYQGAGEEWESGFLMFQDARLQFSQKLKVDARVTFFDTDSFDTRVYQFENDLLYVLSNVALSDRGERMYVVANYKVNDWMQCWLKYSITTIEDAQSLSSGLGEVQGNKRSFLGAQVRVSF